MAESTIQFVVGNSYQRLPSSRAELNRSGEFRKIHDWVLFVDILNGDPDLIERVSFDLGESFRPSVFVCASPVPEVRPDGNRVWRFSTRQQSYGAVTASLRIRGAGGSSLQTSYSLQLVAQPKKSPIQTFYETRPARPFKMLKLSAARTFGIELELTSAVGLQPEQIGAHLQAAEVDTAVVREYRDGRATSSEWKIVPDSSILCSASLPDCNKFELVSPVLQGGNGLGQVSKALRALNALELSLKVNKSMGFHVHIDVSSLALGQLIKVCQNFIKYEDVMDSFMPPSRRTGSDESNRYFRSNRASVNESLGASTSNKRRHDALAACTDLASLACAMNAVTHDNPGRYYKLNLQNLVNGRQSTIEFRQHSATMNYEKVSAWVRFCVAFVDLCCVRR